MSVARTAAPSFGMFARVANGKPLRPQTVSSGLAIAIDDLVDSRSSLTVCGYLLRAHGSGNVYPLALAQTTLGGSD